MDFTKYCVTKIYMLITNDFKIFFNTSDKKEFLIKIIINKLNNYQKIDSSNIDDIILNTYYNIKSGLIDTINNKINDSTNNNISSVPIQQDNNIFNKKIQEDNELNNDYPAFRESKKVDINIDKMIQDRNNSNILKKPDTPDFLTQKQFVTESTNNLNSNEEIFSINERTSSSIFSNINEDDFEFSNIDCMNFSSDINLSTINNFDDNLSIEEKLKKLTDDRNISIDYNNQNNTTNINNNTNNDNFFF